MAGLDPAFYALPRGSLIAGSSPAMTVLTRPLRRHCEERSDEAIQYRGILRARWDDHYCSISVMAGLDPAIYVRPRGSLIAGSSPTTTALTRAVRRHCEERSDEAIQYRGTAGIALDRHAAKRSRYDGPRRRSVAPYETRKLKVRYDRCVVGR